MLRIESVKPSAGLGESLSRAEDGGLADATKYHNIPIAKLGLI
jgi:hypothetical protein